MSLRVRWHNHRRTEPVKEVCRGRDPSQRDAEQTAVCRRSRGEAGQQCKSGTVGSAAQGRPRWPDIRPVSVLCEA